MSGALYGVVAEFADAADLLTAARRTYQAGWRDLEAYSPFPIEGLAEAIGDVSTPIPAWTLAGGLIGAIGGFGLQAYGMGISYPFIVGGRPLFSWPAYIAVTFELTVLGAALAAVISMLALNRLPEPHHPMFNLPAFQRASTDRFFLCLSADDPQFDREAAVTFLASLTPEGIADVPR